MITQGTLDTVGIKVDLGGTDVHYDVTGMVYDPSTGKVTGPLTGNQGNAPTTPAPLVTAPTGSLVNYIDEIRLFNTHATLTRTVTIFIDRNDATPEYDATTQTDVIQLLPGEKAIFTGSGWTIYDATGVPKMSVISPIASTQAEIEAGTGLTTFISPGRAQFHPSAVKCWGFTTGAGTPVLASPSYNVTSITDTALGRLTVTIGVDFSSANWTGTACSTNATAALKIMGLVTKAAGSVIVEAGSAAATLADPGTGWEWQFVGDQ